MTLGQRQQPGPTLRELARKIRQAQKRRLLARTERDLFRTG
jgi:hypothetical protein